MKELKNDPIMSALIIRFGQLAPTKSQQYFIDLASSIVGQQLSNKAADTIWSRVVTMLGGEITPSKVLATADEEFRKTGVSGSKTKYIKNLAEAINEKIINLHNLEKLNDEQVIEQLTKIKGIGKWTAEMFLIFTLGRPDVFSFGDGGLYSAMKNLYGEGKDLSREQISGISQKWKPYRSYASLYLWKSLDNENAKK